MIQYPDAKVQAVIAELTEQRNVALDTVAVLKGDLAATQAELAESNASILVLSTKVGDLQKALDGPPEPPAQEAK